MPAPRLIRKLSLGLGSLQPLYGGWFRRRDETQRTYRVQDKRASQIEYNVAMALDRLGIEYTFQLSLEGGRSRAFGMVLDFLLSTVPLPTPLWVNSEYYHRGQEREEDILQQQLIDLYMHGQVARPQEIWWYECQTIEQAIAWLRANLGA